MKMRRTTILAVAAIAGILTFTTAAAHAERPTDEEGPMQERPDWIHTTIDEVRADRAEHGRPWQEFIRVPDLYVGLYEIPSGGNDGQSPHAADEVYYILSGSATALVEGEEIEVGAGSVLYVAKDKEHRFVDITDDLSILVFFATPPEDDDGEEG